MKSGPVIRTSTMGLHVLQALTLDNETLNTTEHGAYTRVGVDGVCILRSQTLEQVVGRPVILKRELEFVMSSFQGKIRFFADRVEWE